MRSVEGGLNDCWTWCVHPVLISQARSVFLVGGMFVPDIMNLDEATFLRSRVGGMNSQRPDHEQVQDADQPVDKVSVVSVVGVA